MTTLCKNCGAMLDETVETCPDCRMPNPWFDQQSKGSFLSSPVEILMDRSNLNLTRTLLVFGALNVCWAVVTFLTILGTPWSKLPFVLRMLDITNLVLGAAGLALAFRPDLLEGRPMWRVLARVVLIVDFVWFTLLFWF